MEGVTSVLQPAPVESGSTIDPGNNVEQVNPPVEIVKGGAVGDPKSLVTAEEF